MRVLHITAIVQRAKDTEILYFRRLLNSNVWSPDCRANCSNLNFWSFSWSCVGILGSHSEEQFLGEEVDHRRIFSSQSNPSLKYFRKKSNMFFGSCDDHFCIIHKIFAPLLTGMRRWCTGGRGWQAACPVPPSRETKCHYSLLTHGTRR